MQNNITDWTNKYDTRSLCYFDYVQLCKDHNKTPLAADKAAALSIASKGQLDWQLSAHNTPRGYNENR